MFCFDVVNNVKSIFFDSLVIAKLDILDTFEEVKIGVSYRHKGKVLESFPGKNINFQLLMRLKPICATMIHVCVTKGFH